MANFTPLSRPSHHTINIDPNPRDSLSDGFSYPTFQLLNKQARVPLSEPHKVNPVFPYRLLAIANSKGWFAAVRTESHGTSIALSTLQELRASLKHANENDANLFVPRRIVKLPAEDVNIIAFGMHDTRLLVGFTGGQLLVYDTAHLFTAGTNDVAPLSMTKTSSAPFVQIVPNPGAEPDLAQLVAVIRGDGVVQVLDINKLEPQCGWAGEGEAVPVAISWAPKGKHLAIGLRLGDIVTYALSNNTVPHKQIPPTADGYLVSLDWVGPTLVFKTTYSSKIPESSDATLHVVHVDVKSSAGHYFSLMHPFPAADRNKMHALSLSVPKWDEEPGAPVESAKGLVIVGDMSSVDLEVLAYMGPQWYQQSQENPLQLPLDKNMNDTVLISLEPDLTDAEANVPIMYAYLNDGTLQGWKLDHIKSYLGMVRNEPSTAFNGPVVAQESPAFTAAFSPPTTFAQVGGTSTFGQPSFVPQTPAASPFSQQPAFGQPSLGTPMQTPPAQATGQPAFGGFTANPTNNVFGQPSFGFGPSLTVPSTAPQQSEAITREASMSDETTSLGGLSLGHDESAAQSKSGGGGVFGSFSPPPTATASAFGGVIKPATGFGAFSNYQSTTPSTTTNDASKSPFSVAGSTSTTPTQPAFGQTGFAKPAFGQPAFGQPSFGKPSFSTPTTPGSGGFAAFASTGPNAFTTPSKPPTAPASGGFGGFAGKPATFGTAQAPAFGQGKKETFKHVTGGSPPSSPEPMVEVKSALPVDDDMSPPASPIKRDSTPISTTPAQPPPAKAFGNLTTPVRPAAGFGAFGGISETSPFFQKGETSTTPTAVFGKLASTTPTNPPPSGLAPKFGATSLPGAVKSAFAPVSSSTAPVKAPTSGAFGAFSGTSGGFASFAGSGKSFNELLKEKDEVDKVKGQGNAVPVPEPSSESATLETPKKDEQPSVTEPRTPFTPPSKAVSTTPTVEPRPEMAEKTHETEESRPEPGRKPVSAEESFVEVTLEEGEIDEEAGSKEVKEDAENEDYLSGSLGPSDSEGSIDGTDEEEEEEEVEALANEVTETPPRATSVDPTAISLPISRSPSATPEVPSIVISTESTEKPLPVRETSTTPSGTPVKPETTASLKTAPSTTPAGQPFGIGFSRPSTRPMRSSPLAGTPVTGPEQVEGAENDDEEPKPELKRSLSPKPPPTEFHEKAVSDGDVKAPTPQTPPSLSTRFSPTLGPAAPGPGGAPKFFSTPATPPFTLNKAEPQKKPTILFGNTTGFFGGTSAQPPPTSETQATPPKSPFGLKAAGGLPTSAPLLGAPPPRPLSSPLTFAPSIPTPSELNRSASVPPPDSFAKAQAGAATSGNLFGVKGPTGAPGIFGKQLMPAQTKPPPLAAPLEEGIQKECALLYNTMNQELEELRLLAQEANRRRQELAKTRGGSDRKADLGNPLKWGLVDAEHFGEVLKQYGHDLSELRELRTELKRKVRQAESKMLKAGTRREEIARFTKAQNDKEFVKMLKSRTLGPEHLENQTQLRRGIRALRDRIQKLEAHLQASKKKLAETNSGRPSFRAPTLDTINRTYRNIDITIQFQADEITRLSHRLTKLNVSTTVKASPSSQKDHQLPHNDSRRPFSVTPHIAITTAAALNAERSAQKLKKALLAVRKAPLLNNKAAQVPPARITFKTPQKIAPPDRAESTFKTPIAGPLFSAEIPQTPIPEWSFPEDNFSPSPSPPTRRGAGRTKKHASNAPLKKSVGSVQAPPPSFDWGPLPGFSQPALASVGPPVNLAPKIPPGFVPLTLSKR